MKGAGTRPRKKSRCYCCRRLVDPDGGFLTLSVAQEAVKRSTMRAEILAAGQDFRTSVSGKVDLLLGTRKLLRVASSSASVFPLGLCLGDVIGAGLCHPVSFELGYGPHHSDKQHLGRICWIEWILRQVRKQPDDVQIGRVGHMVAPRITGFRWRRGLRSG